MKYRVTHTTTYQYQWKAGISQTKAWLLPRDLPYQTCEHRELLISPDTTDLQHRRDFFGNWTSYFSLSTPHNEMVITANSIINRLPQTDQHQWLTTDRPLKQVMTELHQDPHYDVELSQFTLPSPFIQWNQEMKAYAQVSLTKDLSLFESVKDLMGRMFADFEFNPHFTTLSTPIATVMRERKGVCQDFSHLLLAMLRSFGLPARYVSGYLETLPPPGKQKLQGSDASHAWVSVYVPGRGWIDLDPTNNMLPSDRHITVGWGRDYSDVPPVKGVVQSSGSHQLKVAVDIIPILGS